MHQCNNINNNNANNNINTNNTKISRITHEQQQHQAITTPTTTTNVVNNNNVTTSTTECPLHHLQNGIRMHQHIHQQHLHWWHHSPQGTCRSPVPITCHAAGTTASGKCTVPIRHGTQQLQASEQVAEFQTPVEQTVV